MNDIFLKKIKKKYFLIVFLSIYSYFCDAQMLRNREGKLETIKMSYITKCLGLSDKEAQQFWVIYPQYLKDLSGIKHKAERVEIETKETLNIRKKYRAELIPVLKDSQRVERVFTLERNYREMLRRELRKRTSADSGK